MIFNTFLSILFQTIIYVFEIFVNDEKFVLDALKKFEEFVAKLELLSLKLIIRKFVMKLTRRSVRRLTRWSIVKWWSVRLIRWSTSRWSATKVTRWSVSRIWKMWIRHNVGGSEIKISKKFLIWKIWLINVISPGPGARDVNMITSMPVESIWW